MSAGVRLSGLVNNLMAVALALFGALVGSVAYAENPKSAYLDLARRGWNYELRTTMVGRDMSIPVRINGRDLAGANLCIIGEEPHDRTLKVIQAFGALMRHIHQRGMPVRYAGPDAKNCGSGRTVILRLYSGHPDPRTLTADLAWMNDTLSLGLSRSRGYAVTSPAMAQTFFGRHGQGTHLMVKQPGQLKPDRLEQTFYRSILIEELFQSFTFGMDVLLFERKPVFLSKLQETPVNLHRLPWGTHHFMRALVNSNPTGLCAFDIFMFHAVAEAPVEQTVMSEFISFIDTDFDRLFELATRTMKNPEFEPLIDHACGAERI